MANYIRDVARDLVTHGEACFEVVFSPSNTGNLFKFRINRIMPRSIRYFFGHPCQLLSSASILPEVRQLNRERIFCIQLPGISAGSWRQMLQLLADIDNSSLNSRLMLTPGFNFETQRQFVEIARLRITSPIPWIHRISLKPKVVSDTYYVYRWLGMQRFRARLLASIVSMINSMLSVAGSRVGFIARIVVDGLPTVEAIDTAIQGLRAGTKGTEIAREFTR